MVDAGVFAKWDACGHKWPDEWCGDSSGSLVRHVSNDEMRKYVKQFGESWWQQKKAIEDQAGTALHYVTRIEWQVVYADAAMGFWTSAIPKLLRMHPDQSRVRIVFGFDS